MTHIYKKMMQLCILLTAVFSSHISSPFILKLMTDLAIITQALTEQNQKNRAAITQAVQEAYAYYTNQPMTQMHEWTKYDPTTEVSESDMLLNLAGELPPEVYEIIEFIKNPEKFSSIGATMPKGILLTGPPGTGKTSIARAIAHEAQAAFFNASGSEFVELYVGAGPKHVRELFTQARQALKNHQYEKAIIFIDEIDAVGAKRVGLENAEYRNTLNELLNQMDGFEQENRIVVIAATNTPEVLDSALTRPGRFDRTIKIGLPNEDNRKKILEHYCQKITCDTDSVDLAQIAEKTSYFSPAELKNLVNEAAIRAAREEASSVTQDHFLAALSAVSNQKR